MHQTSLKCFRVQAPPPPSQFVDSTFVLFHHHKPALIGWLPFMDVHILTCHGAHVGDLYLFMGPFLKIKCEWRREIAVTRGEQYFLLLFFNADSSVLELHPR